MILNLHQGTSRLEKALMRPPIVLHLLFTFTQRKSKCMLYFKPVATYQLNLPHRLVGRIMWLKKEICLLQIWATWATWRKVGWKFNRLLSISSFLSAEETFMGIRSDEKFICRIHFCSAGCYKTLDDCPKCLHRCNTKSFDSQRVSVTSSKRKYYVRLGLKVVQCSSSNCFHVQLICSRLLSLPRSVPINVSCGQGFYYYVNL